MSRGPDQGGFCGLGWILSIILEARGSFKCFKQGTETTGFC